MFLGLDLGTSGIRALLSDDDGAVIGVADAPLGVAHPRPGWSEQDPADWIAALRRALAGLGRDHPQALAATRAIGLSGQMHGAVLVDAAGAVLRPCILWNDTRAAAEAATLDAGAGIREISGNIVFPGFTAPKLAWVARHEPEIFAQIARVLLPKDYLRLWLTGEAVTEMSDAAGTSWLDVARRDWSAALLAAGGMRADQMPRLIEGTQVSGRLRPEVQREFGFTQAAIVAGGAADNAAAACGAGCVRAGQGFVSLGTSGVLLAARDSFAPAPASGVHTFCHALPGRWYQMGVILAATDALNWLARLLDTAPADLARAMPDRIAGPAPLLFLPYLSGERTPHNDATIRGAFAGLDIGHGRAEMVQAVMEGVGFALADCAQALQATGARLDSVLALGGGTRSRFWVETLASILGLPLRVPADGDYGAALGAVRLAMVAAGGDADSILTPPPIAETIDPRADLLDRYGAAHARYRALYPALKAAPS